MNLLKRIIFIIIIISCQGAQEINNYKTFDLQKFPRITSLRLSDLGFNDISYIPLETTEHSLIKRINEIKVCKSFYLIKYLNNILQFKTDGSFIKKIGSEGRGPNEFTVCHDFDIENKNQKIYIVSGWQRKFLVFSKEGEFIKSFQSPQNISNFNVTDKGLLCYSINSFADIENSFNLIDTNGIIIRSYPNIYPWQKIQTSIIVYQHENIFYEFNNHLYKKEIYSDTVYEYRNFGFFPHLTIKQGRKTITTSIRSKNDLDFLMENFITPINLFEFGSFIYYEFSVGSESYSFIGSKKNKFQALINSHDGFVNDIDGGPNIWPKSIKDDYTIISWIDAMELKAHITSDDFKNAIPKFPEKKKEFENLAKSLKETDNPVLMIVRLKR